MELCRFRPISPDMKLFGLVCLLSMILLVPSAASAQEERVVPVVSGFTLSPDVFAVGPGTTMSYALSEDASVYFSIGREQRGLLGRRGLCWPVTRPIGRRLYRRYPKRRCVALKPFPILTASGVVGPNSFVFSGRIGGRALRPGRFRVAMNAIDAAGNSSAVRRSRFEVVRQS
jgi:hypothetical protein